MSKPHNLLCRYIEVFNCHRWIGKDIHCLSNISIKKEEIILTPIVSPLIIYLIGVIGNIKGALFFAGGIVFLALVFLSVTGFAGEDEKLLKKAKLSTILLLIITFIFTIIPDKKTIISMVVAKNVTYERVEKVADKSQEYVKYLIEYLEKNTEKDK